MLSDGLLKFVCGVYVFPRVRPFFPHETKASFDFVGHKKSVIFQFNITIKNLNDVQRLMFIFSGFFPRVLVRLHSLSSFGQTVVFYFVI
jgi:hypothetical protein